MNTKTLIAAAIVSACASTAFAGESAELNFMNTVTPYEVTALPQAGSAGSDIQTKSAGAGEQTSLPLEFANSMEPSAVTAQSADRTTKAGK